MKYLVLIILAGLILFTPAQLFSQYQTKITVAQDGSGDYTTIQAAIDDCKSFPDKRITIHIKNGIYYEKVLVPACNTKLSLIGESAEKAGLIGKVQNATKQPIMPNTKIPERERIHLNVLPGATS